MTVHNERPQIFLYCWPLRIPAPAGLLLQRGRFSDPFLLGRETRGKRQITQQREREEALREPWAALTREGYELRLGERNWILSDCNPAAGATLQGSVKCRVSWDRPEAGSRSEQQCLLQGGADTAEPRCLVTLLSLRTMP